MHDSLLRLPEVMRRSGNRKTKLYELIKNGKFPPPIPLTQRSVAWVESEVQAWIDARIAAARNGSK
jgi:prophage regulatory protein